jgi:Fe2+ or Zn2+ uptake regulation protein
VEKDMKKLGERLARKYPFKIEDQRLDVVGYCQECQEKMQSEERIERRP